jgi:hypothetical protein
VRAPARSYVLRAATLSGSVPVHMP